MRTKEVIKHRRLLSKYNCEDDLYELLDLSYVAFKNVSQDVDFYTYLRLVLSQSEEELKHNV